MNKTDPLPAESCPDSRLFFIGRDSHGNWVVRDALGQYGGLFVNRAEALRFALFENGHQPQAVMMVPGVFELSVGKNARATASAAASLQRAA